MAFSEYIYTLKMKVFFSNYVLLLHLFSNFFNQIYTALFDFINQEKFCIFSIFNIERIKVVVFLKCSLEIFWYFYVRWACVALLRINLPFIETKSPQNLDKNINSLLISSKHRVSHSDMVFLKWLWGVEKLRILMIYRVNH